MPSEVMVVLGPKELEGVPPLMTQVSVKQVSGDTVCLCLHTSVPAETRRMDFRTSGTRTNCRFWLVPLDFLQKHLTRKLSLSWRILLGLSHAGQNGSWEIARL